MAIKINNTNKEFQIEGGKILVEVLQMGSSTQTETGILLPEQKDPDVKFRVAKVIDVAPALDKTNPELQTDRFDIDQEIIITREGGTRININNKEYWIIQPKDVLMIS